MNQLRLRKCRCNALVVACSPLQLVNSLEFLHDEGICLSNVIVVFSGKNDNIGKLKQAENLLSIFSPYAVFWHMRYRKLPRLIRVLRLSKLIMPVLRAYNKVRFQFIVKKLSADLNPAWLVGFGPYLDLAKAYFPEASTCIVDGGSSSLYGQLTKGRVNHNVYFSIYSPYDIGIDPALYRKNRCSLRRDKLAGLPFASNIGVFISANTKGKHTGSAWYDRLLEKAVSMHDGNLIYFKRGNEPVTDAIKICEQHGMRFVEISLPVEDFVTYELGCIPGSVFSVASSAMWFFGSDLFRGRCVNYCLIPKSYENEQFHNEVITLMKLAEERSISVNFVKI